MKYLYPIERYIENNNVNRKANNVNYNFCCSNYEGNLIGSDGNVGVMNRKWNRSPGLMELSRRVEEKGVKSMG